MRSFLVPALALPFAAAAAAQTTWHNLHFGDSRDRVRAQLSAQNIPTELSAEGSLHSTADYELFLPGLSNTLPMATSYHFTPAGTLMDVTLTLDLPAMRRAWLDVPAGEDPTNFAAQHLAGALAGRYGSPLYHSPACEATASKEGASCILFWNGPEQSIALEHMGAHVFIRYQMLASDL